MRRTLACWLALAATLAGAGGAHAAPDKVGYVDVQAAVQRSERAASAQEALRTTVAERQAELERQRQRIETLRGELDKQGALMSQQQRQAKEAKLQEALQAFRRTRQAAQQDLDRRKGRVLQELYAEVEAIARRIGERDGYDLILTAPSVLYAGEGVDLTEQVVERLNAAAHKGQGGS